MEKEPKLSSSARTGASFSWVTLGALLVFLLICGPALSEPTASNNPPESVSVESAPAASTNAETAAAEGTNSQSKAVKSRAARTKSAKARLVPTNEVAAPRVLSPGPENAFTNRVYATPRAPEPNQIANTDTLCLAMAAFLAVALAVSKVLQSLGRYDPWNPRPDGLLAALQRHCPKFYEFLDVLSAKPDDSEADAALSIEVGPARALDSDVIASALAVLTGLKARLAEADDADNSRLQVLQELRKELVAMDLGGNSPGLRPVWQVIAMLDGLLGEVLENAAHLTPSVLRTINGGLDALEILCVAALDAKLSNGSAVRLLAVDDDPISQHAISFALKKVFPAPDVVGNGQAAITLAGKNTYDLIFLDIEMPGMDGFEVCSRIHDLPANRTTPVVFVTGHSNFNSRAQSVLRGAEDLIGKPYLTFEIALKALTLVFRSRLQADSSSASAPSAEEPVYSPAD